MSLYACRLFLVPLTVVNRQWQLAPLCDCRLFLVPLTVVNRQWQLAPLCDCRLFLVFLLLWTDSDSWHFLVLLTVVNRQWQLAPLCDCRLFLVLLTVVNRQWQLAPLCDFKEVMVTVVGMYAHDPSWHLTSSTEQECKDSQEKAGSFELPFISWKDWKRGWDGDIAQLVRASDHHAADAGLIPPCSKGFFSQSQRSVYTLLRCPYAPVCNRMHQHLCAR